MTPATSNVDAACPAWMRVAPRSARYLLQQDLASESFNATPSRISEMATVAGKIISSTFLQLDEIKSLQVTRHPYYHLIHLHMIVHLPCLRSICSKPFSSLCAAKILSAHVEQKEFLCTSSNQCIARQSTTIGAIPGNGAKP